ncbi:MAG: choice-of-anchor J domain-containing protein, partial [Bacteroidia bacterium]|nr:choice-of-anchor J domain-containing protein [Bacteroidia bacterium]
GFLPTSWSLQTSPGGLDWISNVVTGSDSSTTTAAYVDNYANNFPAEESGMLTMPIALGTSEIPFLTFDVAYSPYDATYYDGLRIDISTDCGETFSSTGYFKENLVLATVPVQTSSFFPDSASDWRRDTVDLTAYAGMDVIVSFVNINGYGNGLFIDNILIEDICELSNVCTWTGAIDNDWHKEGNWVCGVPNVSKDVIIPAGTIDCIIYSGQTGVCKTVISESGTGLIIQNDGKLELGN